MEPQGRQMVLTGYLDGSFLKAQPRGSSFALSFMWV
jgi:hypothetical protein